MCCREIRHGIFEIAADKTFSEFLSPRPVHSTRSFLLTLHALTSDGSIRPVRECHQCSGPAAGTAQERSEPFIASRVGSLTSAVESLTRVSPSAGRVGPQ